MKLFRTITLILIAVALHMIASQYVLAQDESPEQMAMWSYCLDSYGKNGAYRCYDQQMEAAKAIVFLYAFAKKVPKFRTVRPVLDSCGDNYDFEYEGVLINDFVKTLDCTRKTLRAGGMKPINYLE